MRDPAQLVQVLLLFDSDVSEELGPALWAALLEVERFYNLRGAQGRFTRYYLSPHVPRVGLLEGSRDDARTLLGPEQRIERALSSEKAAGRYARTYDQEKLGEAVREQIGARIGSAHLLIVTDREITPPPEWRYIIWDDIPGGAVVSTVPTDPHYWRERDADRVSTIKHRVRTACLSITGERLGLKHCENPGCFLYVNVDSVTTLDSMTYLGPEHDSPGLARRGFERMVTETALVQEVVEVRQAEGGIAP